MGMAASQARLLCITARIHDVEYQAQAIQAAKVQLSTQEDEVYREYQEALDATVLTINSIDRNGDKSLVVANFNNLCSKNKVMAANSKNYAITVAQGKYEGYLIVEDDIEEGYYNFRDKGLEDAYQFAIFMLSGGDDDALTKVGDNIQNIEKNMYKGMSENFKTPNLTKYYDKLVELTGKTDIYDTSNLKQSGDTDKINEYKETLSKYRKELYRVAGSDIYDEVTENTGEDFDTDLFNYYVSIYNQIKASNGCVSINDYNGPHGDAANDSEWLNNMVESGQLIISTIETESNTGETYLSPTSPSSDSCLTYTNTSQIDSRAVAKAEAEYEYKLKQLDKKDQKFDLDLSKLETERTALTTEYESVKKVIEDNIDRTFGIFS